jgi:hypothetical protein
VLSKSTSSHPLWSKESTHKRRELHERVEHSCLTEINEVRCVVCVVVMLFLGLDCLNKTGVSPCISTNLRSILLSMKDCFSSHKFQYCRRRMSAAFETEIEALAPEGCMYELASSFVKDKNEVCREK